MFKMKVSSNTPQRPLYGTTFSRIQHASEGETSEEMCNQLHRNGIISKPSVIDGFRAVPRGFFVPAGAQESAYHDAPLRQGCVHLSAPHIYGAVAEALEMHKGMSFLNIGSGSG